MSSNQGVRRQLPGLKKRILLDQVARSAGPTAGAGGDGAPNNNNASSSDKDKAKSPARNKKSMFADTERDKECLERELIATMRSKSETKLGCSSFYARAGGAHPLPKPTKYGDDSSIPEPMSKSLPSQQGQSPSSLRKRRKLLPTQHLKSQKPPPPPHDQLPSQPEQQKTIPIHSARPKLPLARTPKKLDGAKTANQVTKQMLPKPTSKPKHPQSEAHTPSPEPTQQRKSPILPKQQSEKSKEAPSPARKPAQQKKSPMSPTQKPDSPPPKSPPSKHMEVARPTRQQKSIADMRRREAKNETPITMNEVNMTEGEIDDSKGLLMCFLSGAGSDDEETTETASGRKGVKRDGASSRYVDDFQHDPKNRYTAYHYRATMNA